ncbi:MAG TPA: DUF4998 domain-containing protein [Flavisolibacter sp.]|nr:DUF4998 domain-containing protein [Flavisolibacter sp.]
MKSQFTSINNVLLLAILLVTATLLSCSKWDEYKDYTKNGETLYSGKIDSVKAYSGYKRVRIAGQMTADPKVTTIKIFWNNKQDSIAFDAKTSVANGRFDQIFPVAEGLTNFTIYTYDAAGNRSVPVYTSATIYGDTYQSALQNRLVSNAQMQTNGTAKIDWADVNANAGVIGMQLKYTDMANTAHDTTIISTSTTGLSSTLPAYKPGIMFQYRTLYKPTPTAIDTFYTAFEEHAVRFDEDVTSNYMSNTGTPFSNILSPDWRFATLAAPWVTNAAGKNKGGGTYGGWAAEPWNGTTGFINWETWGNTPITNGIIYQATASPLPAGKYTIEYNYYSEVQQNSTVYCVVAAGGDGIPTLANLSTALASSKMYNGANIGSTQPSANETKTFSFTLDTPQVVSIGFLGNLSVNNYFIVRYIKLIQNH